MAFFSGQKEGLKGIKPIGLSPRCQQYREDNPQGYAHIKLEIDQHNTFLSLRMFDQYFIFSMSCQGPILRIATVHRINEGSTAEKHTSAICTAVKLERNNTAHPLTTNNDFQEIIRSAYLPWKKCPNRSTIDRTIKSGIYVLKFVAKNVPRIKPTVIPKSRLISRFMIFTSFLN